MKILDQVDSTQAELKKDLAENPALADRSFVQAHAQTGGRGRQGREWVSPRGNLYLSVLLRGPHAQPTWSPHRMALALIESLIELGADPRRVRIKWPNDLIVDQNQKLSGILCEKIGDHIVAGVGTNFVPFALPMDRPTAVLGDVLLNGANGVTPTRLREVLLKKLDLNLSLKELMARYEAHSLFKKGDAIDWRDEKSQLQQSGTYLGLGPHGEMQVQSDGKVISLYSEEVHLIRK